MPRRIFDCREWPGECTLAISGEEDQVVEAQLLHVVQVHGQEDDPELRQLIRASLKDAPRGA
jgi:putative lipoic acid-binding regulatory protein